MITAGILFVLLISSVLWILFVPVELNVDTKQALYEMRQLGTMKVSFRPGEEQFVSLSVLGIPIRLPNKEEKGVRNIDARPKTRSHVRKSISAWRYLFKGIIKSVRCRRVIIDVDLDDVVLGAQLFPLVNFFNGEKIQMHVNFQKRYYLNLWIQVHINQICWTLIRFFLTKK